MKIFVSWSGPLSQKVACKFREWIPCVLQYVKPYVSSEDIDKGTRWSAEIAKELSESTYGVLCVTAENQSAPWLNFEAGALSKSIDKSFVTPFLLDLKAAELRTGPLVQFQATSFTKDDVRKLVESINAKSEESERVEISTVKKTFEMWWPELEKELSALRSSKEERSATKAPSKEESMLEELLNISRSQQRLLGRPELLVPPDYLDWALGRFERDARAPGKRVFWEKLHEMIIEVDQAVSQVPECAEQIRAARLVDRLHTLYHEEDDKQLPRPKRTRSIDAKTEGAKASPSKMEG